MRDVIVLIWLGFILFAAVFFTSISIIRLFQTKKIGFDKGFFLSLSACAVSVILCLSIWPPLHRVYQDEFAFISQSVNIVLLGKAGVTLKGSLFKPEFISSWAANPKLPGFPLLEAAIFFLARDFQHSYFILNIVLGALSASAVYRIVWLWTVSTGTAWWSAIFWACLPVRITYSLSAASDIAGAFFFLLFILFLSEYRADQAKRFLYAALFTGIYSICIKPFYVILVILGLVAAFNIYRRDGILDKKLLSKILLDVLCLFLPVLCAIPIFLFYDTRSGAYSLSFMFKNICTSVFYLFNYKQDTPLTALFALAAVARSLFYKNDKLVMGLAGWAVGGFLLFSVFNSGGISYPGNAYSDRYFLFLAFPFVFLAGKGMADVLREMGLPLWGGLFLTVLVINTIFASNHLMGETKNGYHYKKTLLLKQALSSVPDEAYILDECAALVTMIGSKKAIQTEIFLDGDHPEEVVFLRGAQGDLYNSDDAKRTALVENTLNTAYSCRPLVAAPLTEGGISATPFLCTKN